MLNLIRYGGVVAGDPEIAAAVGVLSGQEWACGPKTAEFENAAAGLHGSAHAVFVNSGSSALLACMCLLPRGARVAMPALQFPTLYSAALWCGLRPVLVDVDDTLNMDPRLLEAAAPKLDAAAFVHMAGNPANIRDVAAVCDSFSLPLIEDICEAFGATAGGVDAGRFGLASATSTHAAHQISTGEGGLAFTSDEVAYARMRRVRDWGRAHGTADLDGYYPGYVFTDVGLNLHATDIQAAVGIVQLGRLDGFVAARKANYEFLAAKTAGLPVELPRTEPDTEPSWYTFPVICRTRDERDDLASYLGRRGIESRPVVAGNMARQPLAKHFAAGEFPVADKVFRRGLWVSVHPGLSGDDLGRIADAFTSYYGR